MNIYFVVDCRCVAHSHRFVLFHPIHISHRTRTTIKHMCNLCLSTRDAWLPKKKKTKFKTIENAAMPNNGSHQFRVKSRQNRQKKKTKMKRNNQQQNENEMNSTDSNSFLPWAGRFYNSLVSMFTRQEMVRLIIMASNSSTSTSNNHEEKIVSINFNWHATAVGCMLSIPNSE